MDKFEQESFEGAYASNGWRSIASGYYDGDAGVSVVWVVQVVVENASKLEVTTSVEDD